MESATFAEATMFSILRESSGLAYTGIITFLVQMSFSWGGDCRPDVKSAEKGYLKG